MSKFDLGAHGLDLMNGYDMYRYSNYRSMDEL